MANRLQTILTAIRTRDYTTATEGVASMLQTKIEQALAQEKERVAATLVREARDDYQRTYGFDKGNRVVFACPGRLEYADIKDFAPKVVRVEWHGREWSSSNNFDELWDHPGWTGFSLEKFPGGYSQKDRIQDLARLGIPAEASHTPYVGHYGIRVPLKYAKKAGKILFGEAVTKCEKCGKDGASVLTDSGKTVCKECAHKQGIPTFRTENIAVAKFNAEDSSGGRATPGKCAKCGKPAQWYHNRLDKKFCSDCAPNDTMSRIQPVGKK
jgi:hypothetical protein